MSAPADNTPGSATRRRGGSTSRPVGERPTSDRTHLLLEVATRQERVEGRLAGVERAVLDSRDDLLRVVAGLDVRQGETRVEVASLSSGLAQLTHAIDRQVEQGAQREVRLLQILELDRERAAEEREERRERQAREERAATVAAERRAQWWVRLWDVTKQPLLVILGALAAWAAFKIQGC